MWGCPPPAVHHAPTAGRPRLRAVSGGSDPGLRSARVAGCSPIGRSAATVRRVSRVVGSQPDYLALQSKSKLLGRGRTGCPRRLHCGCRPNARRHRGEDVRQLEADLASADPKDREFARSLGPPWDVASSPPIGIAGGCSARADSSAIGTTRGRLTPRTTTRTAGRPTRPSLPSSGKRGRGRATGGGVPRILPAGRGRVPRLDGHEHPASVLAAGLTARSRLTWGVCPGFLLCAARLLRGVRGSPSGLGKVNLVVWRRKAESFVLWPTCFLAGAAVRAAWVLARPRRRGLPLRFGFDGRWATEAENRVSVRHGPRQFEPTAVDAEHGKPAIFPRSAKSASISSRKAAARARVRGMVQIFNILMKAWGLVAGVLTRIPMTVTTLRARANRLVRVFSSDHAQRIATEISSLEVQVHSLRNVTSESCTDFKSWLSAWFRA